MKHALCSQTEKLKMALDSGQARSDQRSIGGTCMDSLCNLPQGCAAGFGHAAVHVRFCD